MAIVAALRTTKTQPDSFRANWGGLMSILQYTIEMQIFFHQIAIANIILWRILTEMAIVTALRTTKTQQDSLLPLDRWSSKARYDMVSTAATRRRALALVGWLVPPLPAAPAVALVGLLHPLQHTGFHLAKTGFKGRDTNGNRRKDYTYDLLDCLTLYLYPKGKILHQFH